MLQSPQGILQHLELNCSEDQASQSFRDLLSALPRLGPAPPEAKPWKLQWNSECMWLIDTDWGSKGGGSKQYLRQKTLLPASCLIALSPGEAPNLVYVTMIYGESFNRPLEISEFRMIVLFLVVLVMTAGHFMIIIIIILCHCAHMVVSP